MFTFYLTQAVSFFSVFFFSFLILTAPKIYPQTALQFGGTNAYVQVDNSSSLQLSQFTLETWFRRDGTGTITTTGTNGITNAVPLLAKGCQQAETPNNVNLNYFLGIDDDTDVLCGDFEEPTGPNHPIRGTTVIQNDIWYHAAFTFDGTQLKLFLNGNLEATVIPSPVVTCASENISALGIGTSIQTTGGTFGYFNGVMDEVRIWSTVRTQLEIQSNINDQLSSPMTGLVARWGLNEGMGTTVSSTAGVTLNGTITGSNYQWVGGAPFNITFPPVQPQLVSPGNGTVVSEFPTLTAFVSDNNSANLIVKFFGRLVEVGEKFTLIGFPDTQYYSSSLYGGTPAIMNSQTQWVVSNKDALNIVYCAGLGDCVEHGDQYEIEWQVFNTAMDYLEDPITTSLPDGLPYGLAVGNHDQSPIGDPTGTTTYYNQYFSASRFNGRNYYGGHYGSNNNNHFDLFSAGGMDFIAIYFEYDTSPDAAITSWAENLLQTYSNRRTIIVSH